MGVLGENDTFVPQAVFRVRLDWPSVAGLRHPFRTKNGHLNRKLSRYTSINVKGSHTDLRCVSSVQN